MATLADEDFSSDSDDGDYVPSDGEAVSEEDDSGDAEDAGVGEDGQKAVITGKRKKTKKITQLSRKRHGGISLGKEEINKDEEKDTYSSELAANIAMEKEEKKDVEEKKKADSLWDDFMKDVGGAKPKPKPSSTGLGSINQIKKTASSSSTPIRTVVPAAKSKVTITKEFDFAGETVRVTKEVAADSKEAQEQLNQQKQNESEVEPSASATSRLGATKRPAASGGGLGSVLGKIGKIQKISTLDKSKLDWTSYKEEEGISDELQIHNRGKEGYIERMAFLERTDHRQFEIEKNLRLSNSKR